MNLFHGYPLDDDQHPTRPWWRKDGSWWTRIDGAQTVVSADDQDFPDYDPEATMARFDKANPLPPPPLLPGQVRLHPNGYPVSIVDSGLYLMGDMEPANNRCVACLLMGNPRWPLLSGPAVWTRADGSTFGAKDCQWESTTSGRTRRR